MGEIKSRGADDQELAVELQEAKEHLEGEKGTFIIDVEVYHWLLHRFLDKLPYGVHWTRREQRGRLDEKLGDAPAFSQKNSDVYKSKTAREFYVEIAVALESSGIDPEIAEPMSHAQALRSKGIIEQLSLRQAYTAYALLRQEGYTRFDLVSTCDVVV